MKRKWFIEETGEWKCPNRGDFFLLNGEIRIAQSQIYNVYPILCVTELRCDRAIWTVDKDGNLCYHDLVDESLTPMSDNFDEWNW